MRRLRCRRSYERHQSDWRAVRGAGGVARAPRLRTVGDRNRFAVCDQLFHHVGSRLEEERLEELAEEAGKERGSDSRDRCRNLQAPRTGEIRMGQGHAGNAGNEKVDELARTYAGDCRSKIREGYLPLEGWQSLLASEYSQGTDVPDDAQMLLDGKITTDEYHMGRGQGKSAQGSLADDLMGAADPEPRPRSIADMLVEPEAIQRPTRRHCR